jgi:hypothetical protein
MPPGTEASGDGRMSTGNTISRVNITAWLAIDTARGSLILSIAGAPATIARMA